MAIILATVYFRSLQISLFCSKEVRKEFRRVKINCIKGVQCVVEHLCLLSLKKACPINSRQAFFCILMKDVLLIANCSAIPKTLPCNSCKQDGSSQKRNFHSICKIGSEQTLGNQFESRNAL